jgi:excisionase family DNA binding protein
MKLLSTNELAKKLNLSKSTVCRMVKRGDLTPINPQKTHFLFDENVLNSLTPKVKGYARK